MRVMLATDIVVIAIMMLGEVNGSIRLLMGPYSICHCQCQCMLTDPYVIFYCQHMLMDLDVIYLSVCQWVRVRTPYIYHG